MSTINILGVSPYIGLDAAPPRVFDSNNLSDREEFSAINNQITKLKRLISSDNDLFQKLQSLGEDAQMTISLAGIGFWNYPNSFIPVNLDFQNKLHIQIKETIDTIVSLYFQSSSSISHGSNISSSSSSNSSQNFTKTSEEAANISFTYSSSFQRDPSFNSGAFPSVTSTPQSLFQNNYSYRPSVSYPQSSSNSSSFTSRIYTEAKKQIIVSTNDNQKNKVANFKYYGSSSSSSSSSVFSSSLLSSSKPINNYVNTRSSFCSLSSSSFTSNSLSSFASSSSSSFNSSFNENISETTNDVRIDIPSYNDKEALLKNNQKSYGSIDTSSSLSSSSYASAPNMRAHDVVVSTPSQSKQVEKVKRCLRMNWQGCMFMSACSSVLASAGMTILVACLISKDSGTQIAGAIIGSLCCLEAIFNYSVWIAGMCCEEVDNFACNWLRTWYISREEEKEHYNDNVCIYEGCC